MTEGTKRYQKGKLYEVDISELHPDPEQPRKYFDEQAQRLTSAFEAGRAAMKDEITQGRSSN